MGPFTADEPVALSSILSRPHRLAVRPVEAFSDLFECGLSTILARVFDGDNVVNLPRARARTVVVPRHTFDPLLLDVPAECIDRATEIVERASVLV